VRGRSRSLRESWRPPYEKTFTVIVRARDEESARVFARAVAGNEGRGVYRQFGYPEDQWVDDVWLDRAFTECMRVEHAREPGVIVYDRREG
jgi:hypothetical protein